MSVTEPSPEYPRGAVPAGVLHFASGFFIAASGLQLAMVVIRLEMPWSAIAAALVLLGAAQLWVGARLTQLRRRSSVLGAALALLGVLGVGAWAVGAAIIGLFTPLPFLATLVAGLSFLVDLLIMRRVEAFAARADDYEAMAEPQAGPQAGPPHSPWPVRIIGMGALSILGFVAWAASDQLGAERLLLRAKVLAGLGWPPSAHSFVQGPLRDYSYSMSPLQRYAEYEASFLRFDSAAPTRFADAIAEEVGWRMMAWTDSPDVHQAEQRLWERGEQDRIALWIAHGLRSRGAFYHVESLLSRSFDPALHDTEGALHLDCDQIAHVFLHIGQRLDIDLREFGSPMHIYLQLRPPAGVEATPLYIEGTNFRRIDVDGRRVDFMGEGIGEDYFIDEDHYPSGEGGTWASPDFAAAAGLYAPATDRDIEDSVVANVLVGLEMQGLASIETIQERELSARLEGSRSYLLVSNLYSLWMTQADRAAAEGDLDRQIDRLRRAHDLRQSHGALLIRSEPLEGLRLVEVLVGQGQTDEARTLLAPLLPALKEGPPRRDLRRSA
jgi:hypothetical protein